MRESSENYLETILILKNKYGNVRSVDIAKSLSYSKPSVSVAIKKLKKDGYVYIDSSGYVCLTEIGLEKANKVYEKHTVITKFLINVLNLDETLAEEEACKMEHFIREETFLAMKSKLEEM